MLAKHTFLSRCLLILISALLLNACGSGDGGLFDTRGVSDYKITATNTSSVTIPIGSSSNVSITLKDSNGAPAANQTIAVQTSGQGSLISNTVTTDSTGNAIIQVFGSGSGGAGQLNISYIDNKNNEAKTTVSYTVSTSNIISLFPDKTKVKTGKNDTSTITARVTDNKGQFVAGQIITFAASSGNLNVTQGTTDSNGVAKAIFSPGDDVSNRPVTITASGQDPTQTTQPQGTTIINVYGTNLTLTSAEGTSTTLPATLNITAILSDGEGTAIANKPISLSSNNNSSFSPATAVTDSTGAISSTVTITTAAGGTEIITATSSLGTTKSLSISASSSAFSFTAPATNEIDRLSGADITVSRSEATGPQVGEVITLRTTRGFFATGTTCPIPLVNTNTTTTTVTTNASGLGTAHICSLDIGAASIEATSVNNQTIVKSVEFTTSIANVIKTQLDRNVLAPTEQTAVTATVLDAQSNPVKGIMVSFSSIDPSFGKLSAASAKTDSSGQASVTYTAGNTPTATDGVIIKACSNNGCSLQDTKKLTVGGDASFITLGTGPIISENTAKTIYIQPYTVLLTDASGKPIANKEITLSLVSNTYKRGYYNVFVDDASLWNQCAQSLPIPNEDVNRNGVLDGGEDANNNGILDPGNIASLSNSTVTTDSTGFASFNILYAKQYASWVDVTLKASRPVTGTESVNSTSFYLSGLASDYTNKTVAPPGAISPYGSPGKTPQFPCL